MIRKDHVTNDIETGSRMIDSIALGESGGANRAGLLAKED